jgi:hypothetical protein
VRAPGKSEWWTAVCLASLQGGNSVAVSFRYADLAEAHAEADAERSKLLAHALLDHVREAVGPDVALGGLRPLTDLEQARSELRRVLGDSVNKLPERLRAYLLEDAAQVRAEQPPAAGTPLATPEAIAP